MTSDDVLLSVVVPVYNALPWLEGCLSSVAKAMGSVPGRSELICVDDGSTDGSSRVVDDWASRLPDVVSVIHQPNSGRGAARNAGLDAARGSWVSFVDADDLVPPDAFARLWAHVGSCGGAGMVKGTFRTFADGGKGGDAPAPTDTGLTSAPSASESVMVSSSDYRHLLFDLQGSTPPLGRLSVPEGYEQLLLASCCGALYRRADVERGSVRFPVGLRFGEDVLFNHLFASAAPSVMLTGEVAYLQNVGNEGTIRRYGPDDARYVRELLARWAAQGLDGGPYAGDLSCMMAREVTFLFMRRLSRDSSRLTGEETDVVMSYAELFGRDLDVRRFCPATSKIWPLWRAALGALKAGRPAPYVRAVRLMAAVRRLGR